VATLTLLLAPAAALAQCMFRPADCVSRAFRDGRCGEALLEDTLAGDGCAQICRANQGGLDAATCTDTEWLGSICGAVERADWDADVAALGALREQDASAELPDEETTSTCFRLTQRREVPRSERERIVPGCAEVALDPGEEPVPCNELERAGQRTIASVIDYGREGQTYEGFGSFYYGARARHWTLASRASGPRPLSPDALAAAARAAWEANGTRVDSCTEYVYEKYYDYSLYEDRVDALGGDYRAAYEAAYEGSPPADYEPPAREKREGDPARSRSAAVRRHGGFQQFSPAAGLAAGLEAHDLVHFPPSHAIGAKGMYGLPLRARDATVLMPQVTLSTADQPRNAFFALDRVATPLPYEDLDEMWQVGTCGLAASAVTICDADLADQLAAIYAEPDAQVMKDWAWHKRKSQALAEAGFLDEELEGFEQRKRHFARLLVRRRQIIRDIGRLLELPMEIPEVVDPAVFDPNIYINPSPVDSISMTLTRQVEKRAALLHPNALEIGGPQGQVGHLQAQGLAAVARISLDQLPVGEFANFARGGGAREEDPPQDAGGQRAGPAARASRRARLARSNDFSAHEAVRPHARDIYEVDSLRALLRALARVDGDIEAGLRGALDAGCLETGEANPCDWSPKLFAQEVLDRYTAEREVDYRTCLEVTGGEVGGLAGASVQVERRPPGAEDVEYHYPTIPVLPVGAYPNPKVACYVEADGALVLADGLAPGSYTDSVLLEGGELFDDPDVMPGVNQWNRSTSHVDQYFRCQVPYARMKLESLQETFGDADFIQTDADGCVTVRLVDQDGERLEEGSDDIGAGVAYGFGWAIGRFQQYVGGGIVGCDLSPEMYGFLDVVGKILGKEFSLVDASVHAQVGAETEFDPQPGQGDLESVRRERLHVSVILLDQLLDEFPVNEALDLGDPEWNVIADDVAHQKTFFEAGATFTIVFVPVSVSAGVAGKIGFRYSLDAVVPVEPQQGQCDLARLDAVFEPYLGVDGFATAAVNLLIVEIGVKISLTIVSLSLPFHTYLKLAFNGDAVQLGAGLSLDLVLGMLSGYFALFLDTVWETYEWPLFRWDGLRFATNLFDVEASVDLLDIRDAVRTLGQVQPGCE